MFVGVLFTNFRNAQKKKSKHDNLDPDRIKWAQIQQKILNEKPYNIYVRKFGRKSHFQLILDSSYFQFTLKSCFLLNVLVIGLNYNNIYENSYLIYYIFLFLSVIYSLELILKILVYGFTTFLKYFIFFYHLFMVFGFAVNFIIFFHFRKRILKIDNYGEKIKRGLNFFQLLGLIRLINYSNTLKTILKTLDLSYSLILNIFLILLFLLFSFGIFGCTFLNTTVKYENDNQVINDYINFKNVFTAIMTLFKISTSDGAIEILLTIQSNSDINHS